MPHNPAVSDGLQPRDFEEACDWLQEMGAELTALRVAVERYKRKWAVARDANNEAQAELARLKDDDSRHRTVWQSGEHLGAVRRWIKWHCGNGSQVTWGSNDILQHTFTVLDLEEIAERIREALAQKGES